MCICAPEDLRLLDMLVVMEGGNRSSAVRTAVLLYCQRAEQLENLTDKAAK